MVANARGFRGRRAEELAAAHLAARGLAIVARNWRRPDGEIDIVARDGTTCVFVEVRARTGEERGHPLETIDRRKRARIVRAARLYLDAEPATAAAFRFDVVGVVFAPAGGVIEVSHIADAFRVDDA